MMFPKITKNTSVYLTDFNKFHITFTIKTLKDPSITFGWVLELIPIHATQPAPNFLPMLSTYINLKSTVLWLKVPTFVG